MSDTHMTNTSPAFRPASDDEMFPDESSSLPAPQSAQPSSSRSRTGPTPIANGKKPLKENVHHGSGYSWNKDEDAPGHLWKRKGAVREAHQAWDAIIDKEKVIGLQYGDVGLADAERRLGMTK